MKATLPKVKIASPCRARWEDMAGDNGSRFCTQCEKRVYNFSAMQPEEITRLIAENESRVCARFYQRTDGTILLENCPVGVERSFRRAKILAFSVLTILGTAALASLRPASRPEAIRRIAQTWDLAVWKIKGWFGIHPPALLGEICVIPPTPPPSTQPKK